MSMPLPKEIQKPEKEVIRVVDVRDDYYIPTSESSVPQSLDASKAAGTRDLSSPTTKEAVLTMSNLVRGALVFGNILTALQKRVNMLKSKPNNLIKPIYPKFSFFSDVKEKIDLQSSGDGTAREQLVRVLSANPFGDMYGGQSNLQSRFENLRRSFSHDKTSDDDNGRPK